MPPFGVILEGVSCEVRDMEPEPLVDTAVLHCAGSEEGG
jgi:hypothetical protein